MSDEEAKDRWKLLVGPYKDHIRVDLQSGPNGSFYEVATKSSFPVPLGEIYDLAGMRADEAVANDSGVTPGRFIRIVTLTDESMHFQGTDECMDFKHWLARHARVTH